MPFILLVYCCERETNLIVIGFVLVRKMYYFHEKLGRYVCVCIIYWKKIFHAWWSKWIILVFPLLFSSFDEFIPICCCSYTYTLKSSVVVVFCCCLDTLNMFVTWKSNDYWHPHGKINLEQSDFLNLFHVSRIHDDICVFFRKWNVYK